MKAHGKPLNTHTIFRAGSVMLSVKLAIGCLVLTMMFGVSTIQAKRFAGQVEPNSSEVVTTEIPVENLNDKLSELVEDDDQLPVAERPGKPDSHNSNGDDVIIRPPR